MSNFRKEIDVSGLSGLVGTCAVSCAGPGSDFCFDPASKRCKPFARVLSLAVQDFHLSSNGGLCGLCKLQLKVDSRYPGPL